MYEITVARYLLTKNVKQKIRIDFEGKCLFMTHMTFKTKTISIMLMLNTTIVRDDFYSLFFVRIKNFYIQYIIFTNEDHYGRSHEFTPTTLLCYTNNQTIHPSNETSF